MNNKCHTLKILEKDFDLLMEAKRYLILMGTAKLNLKKEPKKLTNGEVVGICLELLDRELNKQ